MPVTPSYRTYVLEQLNRAVPPVRDRAMFGGVGLYSGEVFFALISDDALYIRADEAARPEFEALGMPPFRPFEEHGPVMGYYQLPEEVLEEPERLRHWAERAIAGARAARQKKSRSAPRPTAKKGKRKK